MNVLINNVMNYLQKNRILMIVVLLCVFYIIEKLLSYMFNTHERFANNTSENNDELSPFLKNQIKNNKEKFTNRKLKKEKFTNKQPKLKKEKFTNKRKSNKEKFVNGITGEPLK
jgi:hypothetical protein